VGGKYVFIEPDAKSLEELARLVDSGKLTVHVATTLPLKRAAEAYTLSKQGKVRGKIVLVP
jgi:NADPH:quinone reductase-like Zn-dependent oxidoreductase